MSTASSSASSAPGPERDLVRREVELLKADISASQGRIELLKQLRENYRKASGGENWDDGGAKFGESVTTNRTRALMWNLFPPDKIYDMMWEEYADPLLDPAVTGGEDASLSSQLNSNEESARVFKRFRYHAPAEDGAKNYQSIVVDGYVIVLEQHAATNAVEVKMFTPAGLEVKLDKGSAPMLGQGSQGEGSALSSHGEIRPVLVAGTRMSQSFTRAISSKQALDDKAYGARLENTLNFYVLFPRWRAYYFGVKVNVDEACLTGKCAAEVDGAESSDSGLVWKVVEAAVLPLENFNLRLSSRNKKLMSWGWSLHTEVSTDDIEDSDVDMQTITGAGGEEESEVVEREAVKTTTTGDGGELLGEKKDGETAQEGDWGKYEKYGKEYKQLKKLHKHKLKRMTTAPIVQVLGS